MNEKLVVVNGFLQKVLGQIEEEKRKIKRNGFVFDDLNDRWQKLAFTFYTDIASLSTEAEHILEYLNEGSNEFHIPRTRMPIWCWCRVLTH